METLKIGNKEISAEEIGIIKISRNEQPEGYNEYYARVQTRTIGFDGLPIIDETGIEISKEEYYKYLKEMYQ